MIETTRRDALGLLGGLAAATMAGTAAQAAPKLGSAKKTLYWAATVTPCNKAGAFDPLPLLPGRLATTVGIKQRAGVPP